MNILTRGVRTFAGLTLLCFAGYLALPAAGAEAEICCCKEAAEDPILVGGACHADCTTVVCENQTTVEGGCIAAHCYVTTTVLVQCALHPDGAIQVHWFYCVKDVDCPGAGWKCKRDPREPHSKTCTTCGGTPCPAIEFPTDCAP